MGGGEAYTTSPCAFDTDNDGLEDGEEVIIGKDGFFTHANNSDTDGDGLKAVSYTHLTLPTKVYV